SYQPTWTAISKPPYLTALALWNEVGTYGGGGYFEDNHTVCLRSAMQPHKDHLPPPSLHINPDSCERYPPPWLWRMERNGWEVISKAVRFTSSAAASGYPIYLNEPATIYRKFSPDRKYQLTMNFEGHYFHHFGDPRMLTYSVVRTTDKQEFL